MKHRLQYWLPWIALAAGCSFDPGAAVPRFCRVDDDCLAGRVCHDGECRDRSAAPDVGASDVGAGDVGDPDCVVDRDGDGFRFGPGCAADVLDCDDNDERVFPGAAQACNGRDNDCDGQVDADGCDCTDGLVSECGFTVGACETGMRTCEGGTWGECMGGVQAQPETCNGIDDDCNGTVDEGCPCDAGARQPCGIDEGACVAGEQECVDGMWSDCEGAVGPVEETCNAKDDDCDGISDNSPNDVGAPCDTAIPGACGVGVEVCRGGQIVCEPSQQARPEQCNGLDDDCDGRVDEDLVQACNTTCGAGAQACDQGVWGECVPNAAPAELCNGLDDDCDGVVDETFPEDGASCDSGAAGQCAAGASRCMGGNVVCEQVGMPSAEVCDGVDNDCDGLVDEDDNGRVLAEPCGGACPQGAVRLCEVGAWSACDVRTVEVCNTTDDNCDSRADNPAECYARCPGGGMAVGTSNCATGACELPGEICGDGLDNDCDGIVDQGCDSGLADMAFVPGGTFRMGSVAGSVGAAQDEQPIHTVELAAFYIDRYEVTREQYGDCVLAGRCSTLEFGCPLQLTERQRPVTCVTSGQAQSYCAWRGKRLPTEAEWEKAARGPWRREVLWPWGDTADGSRAKMDCTGNLNDCTADVRSLSSGASYYGVHHMAGNAAEWVADYYDADFYTAAYTVQPFNGTSNNDGRVLRGGSFDQALEFGRVANRATADFVDRIERGFRCAK